MIIKQDTSSLLCINVQFSHCKSRLKEIFKVQVAFEVFLKSVTFVLNMCQVCSNMEKIQFLKIHCLNIQ